MRATIAALCLFAFLANGAISAQATTTDEGSPVFNLQAERQFLERTTDSDSPWQTSFSGSRVVIDNRVRYLGGDTMAPEPGSGQSRSLPTMKFPFTVTQSASGNPTLTIGYINGINTRKAHTLGQSDTDYVSSPVVIKLNGQAVHYLQTNGSDIRLRIPAGVIHKSGVNILQVETGYYFPERNRIAYDRIQIKDLVLDL